MTMKRILTLILAFAAMFAAGAKPYVVSSPDGRLKVTVDAGDKFTYSLERNGTVLLQPSEIGLSLADGTVWGPGSKFRKPMRRSVDVSFDALYFKRNTVRDRYNELVLPAKGFRVVFRVYDDGMAYRFETDKPVTVESEQATFSFAGDWPAYVPYVSHNTESLEGQFMSSCESQYAHHPLSQWNKERLAFLPIVVEAPGGVRLCITEADLRNYPGLYLYDGSRRTSSRAGTTCCRGWSKAASRSSPATPTSSRGGPSSSRTRTRNWPRATSSIASPRRRSPATGPG